jgi:hypothetical protein
MKLKWVTSFSGLESYETEQSCLGKFVILKQFVKLDVTKYLKLKQ